MKIFEKTRILGFPSVMRAGVDEQGQLVQLEPRGEVADYVLMPGFFDTHLHGYGGVDFSDPDLSFDGLMHLSKALGQTGLSYCLATFVSLPDERIQKNVRVLNDWMKHQKRLRLKGHTQIVGIHFEGPFISAQCKGAHGEHHIQEECSFDLLESWCALADEAHWIKMTIAPEAKGALNFIKRVQARNACHPEQVIRLFLGHSSASTGEVERALKNGAAGFTHLGNASLERVHRLERAITINDLASDVVRFALSPFMNDYGIELITDGKHVSDEFIRLVYRLQKEKILLVSDALGARSLGGGVYQLGDVRVQEKKGAFYIEGTDVLAGSKKTYREVVEHFAGVILNDSEDPWMDVYRASVLNPRRFSCDGLSLKEDRFHFVIGDRFGKINGAWVNGEFYSFS